MIIESSSCKKHQWGIRDLNMTEDKGVAMMETKMNG